MKDFSMSRHGERRVSEKATFGHVALFCIRAFCSTFTLLYFLVQIYEHAKNIG